MRLQRQLGRNQSVQLLNGYAKDVCPPLQRFAILQKRYRLGLHLAMARLRIGQHAIPYGTAQRVLCWQRGARVPCGASPVLRRHGNCWHI
jgi:hypothetical protein